MERRYVVVRNVNGREEAHTEQQSKQNPYAPFDPDYIHRAYVGHGVQRRPHRPQLFTPDGLLVHNSPSETATVTVEGPDGRRE
jgi:hypothetical protein